MKTSNETTIKLDRGEYRIEATGCKQEPYLLIGKRGKKIGLVRNIHSGLLYAVDYRNPRTLGVLTDENGYLEVLG